MKPLGTLTIPAGQSVNNKTTAVPFSLPIGCPAVEVTTAGGDVVIAVANDAAVPPTLAAAAATGFALTTNVSINISLPPYNPNCSAVIAAFSTAGASVQVQALWST